MIEFLQKEHIGRIATIDKNGFPFVAPMNFLFYNDMVYIHGFPRGEKYENIKLNAKCGFEVDRELAFLPSYFFEPPTDAEMERIRKEYRILDIVKKPINKVKLLHTVEKY